MKLCSRRFVLYCRNCPKDDKFRYFIFILLSVIELLFLSLTVEALQGKMCHNSLPSEGGKVTWSQDFRGKGSSLGNIFGFDKTRRILLSDSANCTMLRAVVLTQYRRVTDRVTDGQTDRQTDGIAVASTALAMRALRRAIKMERRHSVEGSFGREFSSICIVR